MRTSTTRHLAVLTRRFGLVGRLLFGHVAVTGSDVAADVTHWEENAGPEPRVLVAAGVPKGAH
jgi:hypothetical protein